MSAQQGARVPAALQQRGALLVQFLQDQKAKLDSMQVSILCVHVFPLCALLSYNYFVTALQKEPHLNTINHEVLQSQDMQAAIRCARQLLPDLTSTPAPDAK